MRAPERDLEAWIASASDRLGQLGAAVEVKRTPVSAVLRIRRLALVERRSGAEVDPSVEPDGEHLEHRPERHAAVLTLYRSGTAMWQGEPSIREWARGILPDAVLGAARVSVP